MGTGVLKDPNLLAVRHDRSTRSPDFTQPTLSGSTTIPNPDAKGNVAFCDGHGDYVMRRYAHHPKHYEPKWEYKAAPQ